MSENESIALKCKVTSTDFSAPLGLRIWLDDTVIYENAHVKAEEQIEHSFSDSEGSHELSFELFGKLPQHTKISDSGEILQDAMLSITSIELDEIDVFHLVENLAVYKHDFNGTQPLTEAKFHGPMGCNGKATIHFTTPVYMWMLENM